MQNEIIARRSDRFFGSGLFSMLLMLLALIYLLVAGSFDLFEPLLSDNTPAGSTLGVSLTPYPSTSEPGSPTHLGAVLRQVALVNVVDGDTVTVMLDGKTIKVRLIGIDTPEITSSQESGDCFASESKLALVSLLQSSTIYLETDASQGELDRYGRTLAYLWYKKASGEFNNSAYELIRNGYGSEYTYNKAYKYQREFKTAQTKAETEGLGMWGLCPLERLP